MLVFLRRKIIVDGEALADSIMENLGDKEWAKKVQES